MLNATQPPRRMRFSFESRCRIVQLVLAGESPQAAAAACGASRATGYRLWRRYREGGWEALADRPSTPRRQPRRLSRQAEQEIVAWRERTGYGAPRLRRCAPPSHRRRRCAQRYGEGLPLAARAADMRAPPDRPPLHAPLLALDERESGSAREDAPQRMGLPLRLPKQRTPKPRPP